MITASRTRSSEPFQYGAKHRLGDFASLVAQAIANAEARRELGAVAEEQAALQRVATLVAGGKPQREVLEAVMHHVGHLLEAQAVYVVRWEGMLNEVAIVDGWERRQRATAPTALALPPRAGRCDPHAARDGRGDSWYRAIGRARRP